MRAARLLYAVLPATVLAKAPSKLNCLCDGVGGGIYDRPLANMVDAIDKWWAHGGMEFMYKPKEFVICDWNNKGEENRSEHVYCARYINGITGNLAAARLHMQTLLDNGCQICGQSAISGTDGKIKDGALEVKSIAHYDYNNKFKCAHADGQSLTMNHEPREPVCYPEHFFRDLKGT